MNLPTKRLLWVLGKFAIKPPTNHLQDIINKYDSLDWSIESIHIYAWVQHRRNWNITNWVFKLDSWGTQSSKRPRTNPYASKTPNFDACRAEIEALDFGVSDPAWVEASSAEEDEEFEPETMEEIKSKHGVESDLYKLMLMNFNYCEENNIKLGLRYPKLLTWLEWRHNTHDQIDCTYRKINHAIDKNWFTDDLLSFVGSKNFILYTLIKFMSKPRYKEIIKNDQNISPAPQNEELDDGYDDVDTCIIDDVSYTVLYSVNCRVEGCRLPMLGRVLSEEDDEILVWLIAPIKGQDKFWLKKAFCRRIEDDIESQKGNITKDQIQGAIKKLVGEQ